MIKVESDLEKSKNVREKQLKDTAKQIEDLKNGHSKQVFYIEMNYIKK
jgi:hypothetical protein